MDFFSTLQTFQHTINFAKSPQKSQQHKHCNTVFVLLNCNTADRLKIFVVLQFQFIYLFRH